MSDGTMAKRAGRRQLKQDAQRHFQRWSVHYDRDIINILLFEPSYRRVLGQLRQWRREGLPPMRVLDVGCGTGTLGAWCITGGHGASGFVGIDMSEHMIAKAQEKAEILGIDDRAQFMVGDAERLPFESGSFDVISCCNSFHHYPHQQRAVRELRRVLAPGGRLILIDGSRDDPLGYFIFEVCVARAEQNVHHCSAQRFRRLVDRAGFSRLDQRVFGVCPPALMNIAYV